MFYALKALLSKSFHIPKYILSISLFSIKPLPVHGLLKPFACNQCLVQISTRAMQLRHLVILSIKTTGYIKLVLRPDRELHHHLLLQ